MSHETRTLPELIDECLRRGDAQDWDALVRKLQPLVARVAARCGARWGPVSREQVEDLTQEAFLRLCRNEFAILQQVRGRPEGAVVAFIKVTVANLVHDVFRAERSIKRHPAAGLFSAEVLDHWLGETRTLDALERSVLLREIDTVMARKLTGATAARDRRIFWLHHRQGMTARAIADIPGIGLSDKGVESTLHRINVLVKEELEPEKGFSTADT